MTKETYNVVRVQNNLQALAELKVKDPNPDILKKYTGWGGLRNAIFTPNVYRDLKRHVSMEEIASLKNTLTSAYYTPNALIQFIYEALAMLKKPFKTILEPSAGHGLFFDLMPEHMKKNAKLFAVEMDALSCRFIRALHPDVHLHHGGFEQCHPKTQFDLIIGNPPYGRETLTDKKHADLANLRIHHYFVTKCMRLLEPKGILAMVLPRYFLDNRRDHARDIIHQERGSLLAAYRLPDNLFADAKVTVDIVFLIKEEGDAAWRYFDRTRIENENMFINRYFIKNPSHIIGDLGLVEAYGRPELSCRADAEFDTIEKLKQHLAHFPPKKLPTIEECKTHLMKRLSVIDKQIQALMQIKNQLTRAQRDLQLMEQKFLKDCMETVSKNHLFEQAP